jgi:hypothetical protein
LGCFHHTSISPGSTNGIAFPQKTVESTALASVPRIPPLCCPPAPEAKTAGGKVKRDKTKTGRNCRNGNGKAAAEPTNARGLGSKEEPKLLAPAAGVAHIVDS